MLTTITPYWKRPEALAAFLKALTKASHRDVSHLIIVIGNEKLPDQEQYPSCRFLRSESPRPPKPLLSIGHYHNLGAELSNTEWIMKLDLDALPNEKFFSSLMPVLKAAQPREWFNAGMFYINRLTTELMLNPESNLLSRDLYTSIVKRVYSTAGQTQLTTPAATNFICRRLDYLKLGGCDARFRGWGWEDYQQIYMLERYWKQGNVLSGPIDLANVTARCRDEISRPKARDLYARNSYLALLHRFHSPHVNSCYKSDEIQHSNRNLLFEYIQGHESGRSLFNQVQASKAFHRSDR